MVVRRLTLLLFAAVSQCFGAVGDIKQANVEASGWVLNVTIASETTNGAFSFNLGANNVGPGNVALTVYSPGFDSTGTSNWAARTVFVTKALRLPYPNQGSNDCVSSSGDAVARLVLSDYIYVNDVVSNAVFAANWYSNNVPATNGLPVVNNSVTAYPKCIGHFVLENRRPVNSSQTIEVFAVQKYAQQGKPVARVNVTATGESSGHVESGSATVMTKSARDGKPVYAVTLTLSAGQGFTRGEVVDIDFTAFPWLGNAASKLNSTTDSDGVLYQLVPLKWTVMDKLISVVDPGSGNDSTGVASTSQATADASPVATISGALTKIAAQNNSDWSLNRTDGGEVQCKAGTYKVGKYSSQASTAGYFTITRHSSTTRGAVIFDSTDSASQYAYQRFHDVTFTRPGNGFLVFPANGNVLVMEAVNFFDPYGSWYDGDTGTDLECFDCVTTNSNFTPLGTDKHYRLMRSCTYSNLSNGGLLFGRASCLFGNTVVGGVANDVWNFGTAGTTNRLAAFNIFKSMVAGSQFINFSTTIGTCINFAVVGNSYERIQSDATPIAAVEVCGATNILLICNTFAGQRWNHENDYSTPHNYFAQDYVGIGNIFSARGNHFADTRTPGNATLTGYWPVDYSVGWRNNFNEGISAGGEQDFWGANCNDPGANSFSVPVPVLFANDASLDGSNRGGGDYHLVGASPARPLTYSPLLPFDLNGIVRLQNDIPGAFGNLPSYFQNVRLTNARLGQ